MSYLSPYQDTLNCDLDNFYNLETLFNTFLAPNSSTAANISIEEKNNTHIITTELPGYKKAALNIEVKDKVLYINAKNEQRNTKRQLHVGTLNLKKAKAILEDGILTIELPKSEENKTHKIEVS